ncbi:MAG: type VI secretion system baseplate subunit TssG, partial [Iodobacter sp.]
YDTEHPERPATVRTTFLGLYGVDSRLPYYFLDNIALRKEGSDALAAFLDIFNHRITSLFYRAWSKYRYPVGFKANGTDCTSEYLLSLIGFGIGHAAEKQSIPAARLLALLGPLSQKTRTRQGLTGVLHYLLPESRITVQERFPVKVRVIAEAGLGQGSLGLGQGCLLGKRVLDQNRTIKISIEPASAQQAMGLMPGSAGHRDLFGLLKIYLGQKYNAHLDMHISASWIPRLQLGQLHSRLGQTTRLSSSAGRDAVVRIQLGKYMALAKR